MSLSLPVCVCAHNRIYCVLRNNTLAQFHDVCVCVCVCSVFCSPRHEAKTNTHAYKHTHTHTSIRIITLYLPSAQYVISHPCISRVFIFLGHVRCCLSPKMNKKTQTHTFIHSTYPMHKLKCVNHVKHEPHLFGYRQSFSPFNNFSHETNAVTPRNSESL